MINKMAVLYRVSVKKVPLLIEFLVGITLKIQLKGVRFFSDTLYYNLLNFYKCLFWSSLYQFELKLKVVIYKTV